MRTVTDRQTRPVLWTKGEEAAIVTTVRRVTDTAAVWEEQWPVAGKMNKTKYFRLQLHDSNTGRLLEGNLKTARRLFEDLFKTASRPLKDLSQKDGY